MKRRLKYWCAWGGAFVGLGLFALPTSAEMVRDVEGLRIELGELLPDVADELKNVDIGATPPPGSSRLLTRKEVARQLQQAGFEPSLGSLPDVLRVRSPGKKYSANELSDWLTPAVRRALPSGVTLVRVKATSSVTLSPDANIGQVLMPKLPKRVGTVQTALTAVLTLDQETTHHLPISAVVTIDSGAARYDVERGSDVTLLIRKRSLRISAAGTALKDADIGDVVSVRVKNTGHTLLARLINTTEAEVVDSK